MNRTVYKYALDHPKQRFQLSPDAKVVHVDYLDNKVTLWIEEAPNHGGKVVFFFEVCATGSELPPQSHHVGTCIVRGLNLVWHVYLLKSSGHTNSAYRLNHT